MKCYLVAAKGRVCKVGNVEQDPDQFESRHSKGEGTKACLTCRIYYKNPTKKNAPIKTEGVADWYQHFAHPVNLSASKRRWMQGLRE